MTITLPPELELALTQQAVIKGTQPESLALDELNRKFLPPTSKQDSKNASTLTQRLLELACAADDLPRDMARNHDHYIHGIRKR